MWRILVIATRLPWFLVLAPLLAAWTILYVAWSLLGIVLRAAVAPLYVFVALFRNRRPTIRWFWDHVAALLDDIPHAWARRIDWLLVLD